MAAWFQVPPPSAHFNVNNNDGPRATSPVLVELPLMYDVELGAGVPAKSSTAELRDCRQERFPANSSTAEPRHYGEERFPANSSTTEHSVSDRNRPTNAEWLKAVTQHASARLIWGK